VSLHVEKRQKGPRSARARASIRTSSRVFSGRRSPEGWSAADGSSSLLAAGGRTEALAGGGNGTRAGAPTKGVAGDSSGGSTGRWRFPFLTGGARRVGAGPILGQQRALEGVVGNARGMVDTAAHAEGRGSSMVRRSELKTLRLVQYISASQK
jgi:hypothetical protein